MAGWLCALALRAVSAFPGSGARSCLSLPTAAVLALEKARTGAQTAAQGTPTRTRTAKARAPGTAGHARPAGHGHEKAATRSVERVWLRHDRRPGRHIVEHEAGAARRVTRDGLAKRPAESGEAGVRFFVPSPSSALGAPGLPAVLPAVSTLGASDVHGTNDRPGNCPLGRDASEAPGGQPCQGSKCPTCEAAHHPPLRKRLAGCNDHDRCGDGRSLGKRRGEGYHLRFRPARALRRVAGVLRTRRERGRSSPRRTSCAARGPAR